MPMDVEFAKDGRTGELFILQARPETVESRKDTTVIEHYRLKSRGSILIQGRSVGTKIASGAVRVIADPKHLDDFQQGEILVADKTDPDWEPIMKKAAAIVTNRGGRTCHAAIVSRELGLPAIVGTEHGTELLHNGQTVTVSCAEGDIGFVYDGKLSFEVERTNLKDLPRPRTKVMMNVANPEEAFRLSFIPNDGVGLAREEFIISNYIKVHPLALVDYAKIDNPEVKANIDNLTAGYDDKPQFFVDKLAQGVAMIAAAFYPKDVIVRLSDFKTNEYANLIGGRRIRAGGRKSNARFPRRVPLLQRKISGRLRTRMPRHEKSARRNGPNECKTDGPVLPHGRRRPQSHRRDGEAWLRARRGWA